MSQGLTSLVIDVRDHIGGNCYDYVDEHGRLEAEDVFMSPN